MENDLLKLMEEIEDNTHPVWGCLLHAEDVRSLRAAVNAKIRELSTMEAERDRAVKACEQIGAQLVDEENDYTPTKKPRFCNQAGPMGGGCKDSWHVGGNYGSHVCCNPNHHDDYKI